MTEQQSRTAQWMEGNSVATDIKLPIDQIPGSDPPIFCWKQTVDSPNGRRVIDHQGALPPNVEVAASRMVAIVKQLLHDNLVLQGTVKGLHDRLNAQATPPALPTASTPRRGKAAG